MQQFYFILIDHTWYLAAIQLQKSQFISDEVAGKAKAGPNWVVAQNCQELYYEHFSDFA